MRRTRQNDSRKSQRHVFVPFCLTTLLLWPGASASQTIFPVEPADDGPPAAESFDLVLLGEVLNS
jgi:hypothetical protein